jgi:hypothetical protein
MAHHISQLESELQNILEAVPKASLSFSVSDRAPKPEIFLVSMDACESVTN